MKRLCMRSLVRVTCFTALLALSSAALSLADPDPTGGGYQGVPDEIQTRLPPGPVDDPGVRKHYVPAPAPKKYGGPIMSASSVRDVRVLSMVFHAWQTQIRFMIQH